MSNSSNFNLSCVWTGLHFKRNLTELSYLTFQPVLTVQTGQLLFSTSFWARIGCHWSQLAAQRSQSELEVTLAITLNGDLFCLTRSLAAPGTAKIVTVWEVRCTKNYSLASRPAFRRATSIRSAKPSATPSSSASDPFWFEFWNCLHLNLPNILLNDASTARLWSFALSLSQYLAALQWTVRSMVYINGPRSLA